MKIVQLSGKQGSGKTTTQMRLTKDLFDRWHVGAHIINFADVLYEMHNACLGIMSKYAPEFSLIGRGIAKDGPLLQLLGTEWGRKTLSENVWLDCMRGKIKRAIEIDDFKTKHGELKAEHEGVIIIGDCRFENEFDAFPQALRVRLECPEDIRQARCSMWRDNKNHPSEVGLDEYTAKGKFDLTLDTSKVDTAGIVSLIMCQLDKGDWQDKRG